MLIPSLIFVLSIAAVAALSSSLELAVYALSFWHYLVYVLAFCLRRIDHHVFVLDAALLKSLSIVALAVVLAIAPPGFYAVIIVAIGFGLNLWAAAVIGKDRTYYGVEVKGMPVKIYDGAPFSWVRHPMLIGNALGFGGFLLDQKLFLNWWPLFALHIVFNVLILLMELQTRVNRSLTLILAWLSIAGGTISLVASLDLTLPHAVAVGIASVCFGSIIIKRYSAPARSGSHAKLKQENCHDESSKSHSQCYPGQRH